MTQGIRSAATITVLVVLLVGALVWGWSAATRPLPGSSKTAICVPVQVAQGTKVYPDQVTVSVLNAGQREGLAGRTMGEFRDAGFAEGNSNNAPSGTQVGVAQIWTSDPTNPAVRLVATRFGKSVKVVRRDSPAAGVVVVVGDRFKDLAEGRTSIVARRDTEICSPPAP